MFRRVSVNWSVLGGLSCVGQNSRSISFKLQFCPCSEAAGEQDNGSLWLEGSGHLTYSVKLRNLGPGEDLPKIAQSSELEAQWKSQLPSFTAVCQSDQSFRHQCNLDLKNADLKMRHSFTMNVLMKRTERRRGLTLILGERPLLTAHLPYLDGSGVWGCRWAGCRETASSSVSAWG